MNCREFETLIHDYLDGELDDTPRADADAHVAQCEACRRTVEEYRRIFSATRGSQVATRPAGLTDRVMARIDQLADEEPRRRRSWRTWASPRRIWMPAAAAAALAACLLLAVKLRTPGEAERPEVDHLAKVQEALIESPIAAVEGLAITYDAFAQQAKELVKTPAGLDPADVVEVFEDSVGPLAGEGMVEDVRRVQKKLDGLFCFVADSTGLSL